VVPVADFILFARSRGLPTTELEQAADAWVEEQGGRREHVIDPFSWIPNSLRRVTGQLPSAGTDLYLVPARDLKASAS
jgi:hypothetical protein